MILQMARKQPRVYARAGALPPLTGAMKLGRLTRRFLADSWRCNSLRLHQLKRRPLLLKVRHYLMVATSRLALVRHMYT